MKKLFLSLIAVVAAQSFYAQNVSGSGFSQGTSIVSHNATNGAAFSTSAFPNSLFVATKTGKVFAGFPATSVDFGTDKMLWVNGTVRLENTPISANETRLLALKTDSKGENIIVETTVSSTGTSALAGDIKQSLRTADHSGWIKMDGRAISTLTATQQEALRSVLGSAVTNVPNSEGKVIKQKGAVNTTGGNNTVTLTQTQMPNYTLGTFNTNVAGAHSHTSTLSTITPDNGPNFGNLQRTGNWNFPKFTEDKFSPDTYGPHNLTTNTSGNHTHSVTVSSNGGGQAVAVEDAYLSANNFIYLGN